MGIFKWNKKKTKRTIDDLNIDDIMPDTPGSDLKGELINLKKADIEFKRKKREHDIRMMEMEQSLKEYELQAQIAELQGMDEEPEPAPDDTTGMILSFLKGFTQQRAPMLEATGGYYPPPPTPVMPQEPVKVTISDDTLDMIIKEIPLKALKVASKLPDKALVEMARLRFPHASDDSIARAIQKIRKV